MKLHCRIGIVCTTVATMALVGCSGESTSPTAPSRVAASPDSATGTSEATATPAQTQGVTIASAPAPTPSAANYETKFLTDMIDHHHMAVMMAEICIQKAVHEELRSLCESIRTSQMAQIEEMQGWLQDWYSISYEPTMKPGDQKMMERLASLSGAEFEVSFMEMMIKHHERAIKEGRQCLDKAYHDELRELCQNIVSTQSQEIAQMQSWLCQWYGECR